MKGKVHIIKGYGLGNRDNLVYSVYCLDQEGVIPSIKNNISGKYECGNCFKILDKDIKDKMSEIIK